MTQEVKDLIDYMSYLSESYWAAGWMMDLEYILWNNLNGKHNLLSRKELRNLRELKDKANSWVSFMSNEEFVERYHGEVDVRDTYKYYIVYTIKEWEAFLMELTL
jgi:hypothetical protein